MEREFDIRITGPASEFAEIPLDPEAEVDGMPRLLAWLVEDGATRLPLPEGMAVTGVHDMRFTRRPGEPAKQQGGPWRDTPDMMTIIGTAIVTYV